MAVASKKAKGTKFRILAGYHRHNGKNLKKGDIVRSEKDLAKKFGKDKFKRLRESDPELDEDTQPRERPRKKKRPE